MTDSRDRIPIRVRLVQVLSILGLVTLLVGFATLYWGWVSAGLSATLIFLSFVVGTTLIIVAFALIPPKKRHIYHQKTADAPAEAVAGDRYWLSADSVRNAWPNRDVSGRI